MLLIDGKKVAEKYKGKIKTNVSNLNGTRPPHLVAILVGHDGASLTYVNHKVRACEEVGFQSSLLRFEVDITEHFLLKEIDRLNNDDNIDGFIVQLPLPQHICEEKVIQAIAPEKDVDGFHPLNVGKLVAGLPTFVSATPQGICTLLDYYHIETQGKQVVVLGRSNIVGRPISILLSQKGKDATVTLAHSRTKNIKELCKEADILIVAIGIPHFLQKDMVKEGAVVVDVGITRVLSQTTKSGWKLQGDVHFDEVAPLCSAITPVPGGVGPMTIISLLENTMKAHHLKFNL